MAWKPTLGAVPGPGATRFRVWAPKTEALAGRIEGCGTHPLRPDGGGDFAADVPGVRAGALYLFLCPDGRKRPDPASLLQPEGVHGPSEVVDLAAIAPRTPPPPLA